MEVFLSQREQLSREKVFSTHVEVFLLKQLESLKANSLLHARGGVSIAITSVNSATKSSPRTWRCFLTAEELTRESLGLLHARGGVSVTVLAGNDKKSVFSTHVEVFLSN